MCVDPQSTLRSLYSTTVLVMRQAHYPAHIQRTVRILVAVPLLIACTRS